MDLMGQHPKSRLMRHHPVFGAWCIIFPAKMLNWKHYSGEGG